MIHDVRDYVAQQGIGEIEVAFEEDMQETKSSETILNARIMRGLTNSSGMNLNSRRLARRAKSMDGRSNGIGQDSPE